MIKIENTDIYGWEAAVRGMRNPMNSWSKSDSTFPMEYDLDIFGEPILATAKRVYVIGPNDLSLMKRLSKAGNDHGKFLRMINVTVDITAPLYWWKELDTYKVGTVANSCSTMHKITSKEFTLDDFSHEHLSDVSDEYNIFYYKDQYENTPKGVLEYVIGALNYYRDNFLQTKDKRYWWQLIQLLPSSYNQKRTIQLNYQVLKSMYFARRNHKLDEWREFCRWCETLPYFKEVCIEPDTSSI